MKALVKNIFRETNEDFSVMAKSWLLWGVLLVSGMFTVESAILDKVFGDRSIASGLNNIIIFAVSLYIFLVQYGIMSDIKNGGKENVFTAANAKYPQLIINTLKIIGVALAVGIPVFLAAVIGVVPIFGRGNTTGAFIAVGIGAAVFIPIFGYYIIKRFLYGIVIALEDEEKPMKRSIELMKGKFWIVVVLITMISLAYIPYFGFSYLLYYFNIDKIVIELSLLPVSIIIDMYSSIAILNLYLLFKKEKDESIQTEQQ